MSEPTFSDDVFGGTSLPFEAEDTVKACLKLWMPTYLRWQERRLGKKIRAYPNPRSWRMADTMEERFPEQQIPAVQIMLTEDADIQTEGSGASITYNGTVDILTVGKSPESARFNAALYAFTMGLALEQQLERMSSLGPSILGSATTVPVTGFGWGKVGVPAIGKPDSRWLAVGSVAVSFEVSKVFESLAGPEIPTEEIPEEYPLAESHDLNLEEEPN